jgi:hypothetical protein
MITVRRCLVYAMLCFPLTVSLAVADVNPPSDLICDEVGNQVDLSWTNNDFYDIIEIHLDGNLFAAVPGSESGVISATPACFWVAGQRGFTGSSGGGSPTTETSPIRSGTGSRCVSVSPSAPMTPYRHPAG